MADKNKFVVCFVCNKRTSPIHRRFITDKTSYLIKLHLSKTPTAGKDQICNACHCRLRLKLTKPDTAHLPNDIVEPERNADEKHADQTSNEHMSNMINVSIKRVGKTHRRCFLCKNTTSSAHKTVVSIINCYLHIIFLSSTKRCETVFCNIYDHV